MVWVRFQVYFYKRGKTFYFSRAVPSDLQHRFDKRKMEVSLRTKFESRARKSAAALSDRLERYWDSLRMEMIYSRELGLSVIEEATAQQASKLSFDEVLELYHRLKGVVQTVTNLAMGYPIWLLSRSLFARISAARWANAWPALR